MFTRPDDLFVVYSSLVLFSLSKFIVGFGPPRTFGRYKLVLKEVETCSELKNNYFSIKLNKSNNVGVNYTTSENSELDECQMTLGSDFRDDVSGLFKVYILREYDSWSLLASLMVPRACSDTSLVVPELFDVLLTTRSPTNICSVPKGTYTISQVDITDLRLSKFPDLPYNKYKINLEVFKNKTVVGCVTFVVNVSPPESEVIFTLK